MSVESMDHYLEILNGYIYDNDKVVTYKWLSKELEVHVNIAKQVLWEFWQKHQNEDNNITSTVMLIGNLKSGGMQVEVVKQSDLITAKDKFNKIISEHIYSIQKSIPDLESLFINDKGDVRFSAIKCNESVERSDEELSTLRWGLLFKGRAVPKKDNLKSPDKPAEVEISETTKHNNQTNKKSTDKKTVAVSQKMGFNNLFAKVPNKENNVIPSTSKDSKNSKEITPEQIYIDRLKENKSGKKEERKSISSFFGKNSNVIQDSPKEKEAKKEHVNKEQAKVNRNIKDNVENNVKMEVTSNSTNNNKTKKEIRGIKRNRSKESKNIITKRKRIIINDDSSDSQSEDELMISESESEKEEIMNTEHKNIKKSPSPPRVTNNNDKARILKMVDRTYEEDGFLVTKKVHVYETCSEDPIEIKAKEESSVEKSVAKVQAKKKQTTLTNFFKRS